MNQETRWLTKYNEVKEFIEREHRNPSKFIPEERGQYLNWIKHNRKLYSAGLLKEGKTFSGGQNTFQKEYYNRWKEKTNS